MSCWLTRALWLGASALWGPWVCAQEQVIEPSAALRCMTPSADLRGTPEYPFQAFKLDQAGRVKVTLSFADAQSAPQVQVDEAEGGDEFVEEVRKHVRLLRVPCHGSGALPSQVNMEFVFRPDARQVYWAESSLQEDQRQRAAVGCLRHVSGDTKPHYPLLALNQEMQGRVLARVTFRNREGAPDVEIVGLSRLARLNNSVEEWTHGYRLPCLDGPPVTVTYVYAFVIEGNSYGFRPGLTLRHVLSLAKGLKATGMRLDTTTMACPFDLRLTYLQPMQLNNVGEVGNVVPTRQPLIQWMRVLQFDVPQTTQTSLFADQANIHVPCMKIDIKPQQE